MKVRAIKRGFFGGQYRRPGDQFDCSSSAFSKVWMEELEKGVKPKAIEQDAYQPLEIPSLMNKEKPKKEQAKKDKPKEKKPKNID